MIDARPWGRSIEQNTRLPNSVIEPATEIERSSPAPPPISLETPLRDNGLLGKPGGPALYLGVCKVMFALMVYAGLRRIEVTQLKWSDIERSSYRASDRVSNETLEGDVIVVRSGKGGTAKLASSSTWPATSCSAGHRMGNGFSLPATVGEPGMPG